jgi:uncharacterized protein YfdQ (DUF2303 family)
MDTEAEAIADLATRAAGLPEALTAGSGREFLIMPAGMTREEITLPHAVAPILPGNITQSVTLQTVDSLVEYVTKFKGPETILFADLDANSITAVIDYHGAAAPNHVKHKAKLTLRLSVEWSAWNAIDKKLMDQLAFARFIEENATDVVAPSGAELLEVCRDIQAVRKADFKKVVRTQSGTERFAYNEETTATSGDVEVPSKFLLNIPVYFNEAAVELAAFLRWNLNDGSLTLGVQLHRVEQVRQAMFKLIVTAAAERTGQPVVFGKLD